MSQESRGVSAYDDEFLCELYRKMSLIRRFEDVVLELVENGDIFSDAHLYQGQEAVAVGTCQPLRDDDMITSTHRPHGHVLAKGIEPRRVMAEIGGKETGISGGRGGEMHMFDPSEGIIGSNGIVGASLPHAAGAALAGTLDGTEQVAVAFFGEGASNQGVVHETMNIAAVWDLPVLFLCENNHYAVTTSVTDSNSAAQVSDRAGGYSMPGKTVDGQDVLAVYEAVADTIEEMRADPGPQMIECETYRYLHHTVAASKMLGDEYRPAEEVEKWRDRDPVSTFAERLEEAGVLDESDRKDLHAEIDAEVDAAVEYMNNGEFPPAEEAGRHLYANESYPDIPQPKYR